MKIRVNGKVLEGAGNREQGTGERESLASFLLNNGITGFRRSVDGSARAPLCGMGICFDCRVKVGTTQHVRACLVKVEEGMEVHTDL